MRIYPQFILWTYLLLPAICLLLSPTLILNLVKAQQQKAKLMANAINVRARTAAALARNQARSHQKRLIPNSRFSSGIGQKPFQLRNARDVRATMDVSGHQGERSSHWDQQEESMGQLQNMWNMNGFGNVQNDGVLRHSHIDADGPEELKPMEEMVGSPRIYADKKHGGGAAPYTGAFFGRNVYDDVVAQRNPLSDEKIENELMLPSEKSANPDPSFKKKKKKKGMEQNYYYPQNSYNSYYSRPYYYGRSNGEEEEFPSDEIQRSEFQDQMMGDMIPPMEKSANPEPTLKKKKKMKKMGPSYPYPQPYYEGSHYYRSVEAESSQFEATDRPEGELLMIGEPELMEPEMAEPRSHHHKKSKKNKGHHFHGRSNENREMIGATNTNIPEEMISNEPNLMAQNAEANTQKMEKSRTSTDAQHNHDHSEDVGCKLEDDMFDKKPGEDAPYNFDPYAYYQRTVEEVSDLNKKIALASQNLIPHPTHPKENHVTPIVPQLQPQVSYVNSGENPDNEDNSETQDRAALGSMHSSSMNQPTLLEGKSAGPDADPHHHSHGFTHTHTHIHTHQKTFGKSKDHHPTSHVYGPPHPEPLHPQPHGHSSKAEAHAKAQTFGHGNIQNSFSHANSKSHTHGYVPPDTFGMSGAHANAQAHSAAGIHQGFGQGGAQASALANAMGSQHFNSGDFGQAGAQAHSQAISDTGFVINSAQAAAQASTGAQGTPQFFQVLGPSNFVNARSQDGVVGQPIEDGGFVMPHIQEIPVRDTLHEMEAELGRFPRSEDHRDVLDGLDLASSIVRSSLDGKPLINHNSEQDESSDTQKMVNFPKDIVDSSLKMNQIDDDSAFQEAIKKELKDDKRESLDNNGLEASTSDLLNSPGDVTSVTGIVNRGLRDKRQVIHGNNSHDINFHEVATGTLGDVKNATTIDAVVGQQGPDDILQTSDESPEETEDADDPHKAGVKRKIVVGATGPADGNVTSQTATNILGATIVNKADSKEILDISKTKEGETISTTTEHPIKLSSIKPTVNYDDEMIEMINPDDITTEHVTIEPWATNWDYVNNREKFPHEMLPKNKSEPPKVNETTDFKENPVMKIHPDLNTGGIENFHEKKENTLLATTNRENSSLNLEPVNSNLKQDNLAKFEYKISPVPPNIFGQNTSALLGPANLKNVLNPHLGQDINTQQEKAHLKNFEAFNPNLKQENPVKLGQDINTQHEQAFLGVTHLENAEDSNPSLRQENPVKLEHDISTVSPDIFRQNAHEERNFLGATNLLDVLNSNLRQGNPIKLEHDISTVSPDIFRQNAHEERNFLGATNLLDVLNSNLRQENPIKLEHDISTVSPNIFRQNAHEESNFLGAPLLENVEVLNSNLRQENPIKLEHDISTVSPDIFRQNAHEERNFLGATNLLDVLNSNLRQENPTKLEHDISTVSPDIFRQNAHEERNFLGATNLLDVLNSNLRQENPIKLEHDISTVSPDIFRQNAHEESNFLGAPLLENVEVLNSNLRQENPIKLEHDISTVSPDIFRQNAHEERNFLGAEHQKNVVTNIPAGLGLLPNTDGDKIEHDGILGFQSQWQPSRFDPNSVKEISKFDKQPHEKVEDDATLHEEKLGASQQGMKKEIVENGISNTGATANRLPHVLISTESTKNVSILTPEEIEDIQFRIPDHSEMRNDTKGPENEIDGTNKNATESFSDNNDEHMLGMSLNKDGGDQVSQQLSSFPLLRRGHNISRLVFNASGGPLASIEAEMNGLTDEQKDTFIKQEMDLISEVIRETLEKDQRWENGTRLQNSTQEPTKNETVASPQLFRAFDHETNREEFQRHARAASPTDQTFDAILGAHKDKVDSIQREATDDDDLLMISFIGDSVIKDLEDRRHQADQKNSSETIAEPPEAAIKRSKREVNGWNANHVPITRLISDPTTKIDVSKTLENVGAVVRHSLENPRAPIYHLRSMIGNTKNTLMSAAKIPPNNFLIPSEYEVAQVHVPSDENQALGAINQKMLLSRSSAGSVAETAESAAGDSLGIADAFEKIRAMVEDSVRSGKKVVIHVNNAATDARNILFTAKHAAPRLIVPGQIPVLATRASGASPNPMGKKAILITPRLLDVQENIVGAEERQPDQFVGMGNILDAVGFTKPDQPEVELEKIVLEPSAIDVMKQWDMPKELRSSNAVKTWMKDSLMKDSNIEDSLVEAQEPQMQDTLESLGEAEQSVGAKSLKELFSKMHQEMKEILTSQHEERKRKLKETAQKAKAKSNYTILKKDNKLSKKKPTRKTVVPIEGPIQKPDPIVGETHTKILHHKINEDDATLPPEILKIFIEDIPARNSINENFKKHFLDPTEHDEPTQSNPEDENVGLYLIPELMKPFMGQPTDEVLNNFMRENGDEISSDNSKPVFDQKKINPTIPLNTTAIPTSGQLTPLNLRPAEPYPGLMNESTRKKVDGREMANEKLTGQTVLPTQWNKMIDQSVNSGRLEDVDKYGVAQNLKRSQRGMFIRPYKPEPFLVPSQHDEESQSNSADENVGLYLIPELMKPFMGQPSGDVLHNFMRENGEELEAGSEDSDDSKQPKIYPITPLNRNVTIPMFGQLAPADLSPFIPRPALVGDSSAKNHEKQIPDAITGATKATIPYHKIVDKEAAALPPEVLKQFTDDIPQLNLTARQNSQVPNGEFIQRSDAIVGSTKATIPYRKIVDEEAAALPPEVLKQFTDDIPQLNLTARQSSQVPNGELIQRSDAIVGSTKATIPYRKIVDEEAAALPPEVLKQFTDDIPQLNLTARQSSQVPNGKLIQRSDAIVGSTKATIPYRKIVDEEAAALPPEVLKQFTDDIPQLNLTARQSSQVPNGELIQRSDAIVGSTKATIPYHKIVDEEAAALPPEVLKQFTDDIPQLNLTARQSSQVPNGELIQISDAIVGSTKATIPYRKIVDEEAAALPPEVLKQFTDDIPQLNLTARQSSQVPNGELIQRSDAIGGSTKATIPYRKIVDEEAAALPPEVLKQFTDDIPQLNLTARQSSQVPNGELIQISDAIVESNKATIPYRKIVDEEAAALPPGVLKQFTDDIPQHNLTAKQSSQVPNGELIQRSDAIVGSTKATIPYRKIVDEEAAALPPEVLKQFTDDIPQLNFTARQSSQVPNGELIQRSDAIVGSTKATIPYRKIVDEEAAALPPEVLKQFTDDIPQLNLTARQSSQVPNGELIQRSDAIVGSTKATIPYRKIVDEEAAALPPEVLKQFTDDIPQLNLTARQSSQVPNGELIQRSDAIVESTKGTIPYHKIVDEEAAALPPEVLKQFTDDIPQLNFTTRESSQVPNGGDIQKNIHVEPLFNENQEQLFHGTHKNPVTNDDEKRISPTLTKEEQNHNLGRVLGALNPMMFERYFNENLRSSPPRPDAEDMVGSTIGLVTGNLNDTRRHESGVPDDSMRQAFEEESFNQKNIHQLREDIDDTKAKSTREEQPNESDSNGRTSMNIIDQYQKPFMGFIRHDRVHGFLNQYNNYFPEDDEPIQNIPSEENGDSIKNVVFSDEDEDYYNFVM